METEVISQVALAISRQRDAALWVGPAWTPPAEPDAIERIAHIDWLGVWLETKDRLLGRWPSEQTETPSGRLVIEVPDHIEDVLGERFSFVDVCPHFYLHGKFRTRDPLSKHHRRRTRDKKIEQLNRLKASILLVTGYTDMDQLSETLAEIVDTWTEFRLIVLLELSPTRRDEVVAGLPESVASKIVSTEKSLVELLRIIEERRVQLPETPSIRVAGQSIRLDSLLRSEPPLDQEFIILTEQDVRDPDPQEDPAELVRSILSGTKPPWRGLAHKLEWPRDLPQRKTVKEAIEEVKRGKHHVVCVNLPAEPGAGLTMLLHQMAFEAAREEIPVLFHRAPGNLNYDILRSFLTDLDLLSDHQVPTFLIFDADSIEADTQGALQVLPNRLAQDGRRAVIARGIPIRHGSVLDKEFKRRYAIRTRGASVEERWADLLSATLTVEEQQTLLKWAESRLGDLGTKPPPQSAAVIRSWDEQEQRVPLLIFLSSILTGKLREAARLGRHLLDRVREHLEPKPTPGGDGVPQTDDLQPVPVQEAVEMLRAGLGRGGMRQKTVPPDAIASVLTVLSVLGCLRQRIARTVLADIAGVDSSMIQDVLILLEKCDLVSVDLPTVQTAEFPHGISPLAPWAFYTRGELVGLVHPSYGRLILEWVQHPEGAEDMRLLDARGLMTKFMQCCEQSDVWETYPISLLQPIFSALKPLSSHVRFAEDIAMRYLRWRKSRHQEELSRWQWEHLDMLIEAFGWLNDQLVQQSANLLHSRGITTYKSCSKLVISWDKASWEEARKRYELAEKDFHRGIELARQGGSERPGNIITSLGLLYLGWLELERKAGNDIKWRELDLKVEKTLRQALAETGKENPYAAFGLAKYLLSRYERSISDSIPTQQTTAAIGRDLAEAIELLQCKPEPYFEEEWEDLQRQAFMLLDSVEAKRVISQLKQDRDELGFALEALCELQGVIPEVVTQNDEEVSRIRKAAEILRRAEECDLTSRSSLAQLLRYAVFSADPARLKDPAYPQRYRLIEELRGSKYLDEPIWLFDYAMLSFQVGQYKEGAEAFRRLRKGQRFFEVSRDRSCLLMRSPDFREPMSVLLRIVSIDRQDGKGWGRVETPVRFPDPVPFSVRVFRSRGKQVQVGSSITCKISLNPAGPFAEP